MSKVKRDPAWEPLQQMNCLITGDGQRLPIQPHYDAVWKNSLYLVMVKDLVTDAGTLRWLSIKRNDHQTVRDWRDLQQIKNELAGPEIEAIEIYPAESRLVDTSNQYHLWCFMSGERLALGYAERLVMEHPERSSPGSVQRPFRKGMVPR